MQKFSIVCALLAAAALGAGAAQGGKHGGSPRVSVHVLDRSDSEVLNAGGLQVSLRASSPASVQLAANVTGASKAVRLTRSTKVKLRRGSSGGGQSSPLDNADVRGCDPIDPAVCLQPFPNDYFTKAADTPTGRQIDLPLSGMPRNRTGKPVDPSDLNRADGFSPGEPIETRVPGLDSQEAFDKTGAVPITDMGRYAEPDQPIVVINAATGKRQPIWSEIDANPAKPADRNLIVRPAVNFREGNRYIVALRNLKDAAGNTIQPDDAFKNYRDRGPANSDPRVEARRLHMEEIFKTLSDAGIQRGDLNLAWDFTVASRQSLTSRMLTIRDDAFKQLGDTNLADLKVQGQSPTFKVAKVTNYTAEDDSRIARRVEGSVTVPCYLDTPSCVAGGEFLLDPSTGKPQQIPGNTTEAKFTCDIPRVAFDGQHGPARASLYGHGLFGSRGEVGQGQLKDFGNEHNIVFCASDWVGMACADVPTDQGDVQAIIDDFQAGRPPNTPNCDVPTVLAILQDISLFPKLADRVQQGLLNFLYLGRTMVHSDGFASNAAFQEDGKSILDTGRLYYDGNSQGGIIGGAYAAIAVDDDRSVLGVPGMNYSTLLSRSTDFEQYATGAFLGGPDTPLGLYDSYPNELERPLLFGLLQMLWDRAEADGYAQHMTDDPLPNTPAHKVLLETGFGDHQVADVAAETEARTIGAHVHTPILDPTRPRFLGRPLEEQSKAYWGLTPIDYGLNGYDGSAYVVWDIGPVRPGALGTAPAPPTNTAPQPPGAGEDPHEYPRRSMAGRVQKSEFLKPDGRVIDVCHGPCHAGTWTGP